MSNSSVETGTNLILDNNGIWTDNKAKAIAYPESGNNFLFDLEDKSFWFRHRNNVLLTMMQRFPLQGNFADIGGGNGFQAKFVADHFSESDVYLIEPGYYGCVNGRKRGLKHVYNILFQQFDFDRHNVRAVGLFDVLEHIEDDVAFLKSLKQKLPPGSLIYITVPAYGFLWSDLDDLSTHFRRYTIQMIEAAALKSELKPLFTSYFFSYLPPLTFLLRSLPYRLKRRRNAGSIYRAENTQHTPPKVVRSLFDVFHAAELKALRRSSVPAGASLVAVLRT